MNQENLYLIISGLFITVFFTFYSGIVIKRHEKTIIGFYWALREKYTRSYIKPNRVVKLVRNFYKMEDDDTIHWIICLLHYLQLVMPTAPIFLLILPLFIPLETAIVVFLTIGSGPFAVIAIIEEGLLILQCSRCKKIKKSNSKYANREFYNWRG